MSPDLQFWLNWIVQAFIALGTVSAVLYALFGPWLRSRLFPPRLTLDLPDAKGMKTDVQVRSDAGARDTTALWYHVRVENKRRWSPATRVQVFLLRIEEPDASGRPATTWRGEVPILWSVNEAHPRERTIGYPALCDLCSLVKEKWLQLHPIIAVLAMKHQRREACDLTLHLQARGMEADSNLLCVRVTWDGGWEDDTEAMAKRLVVQVVQPSQVPVSATRSTVTP